MKKSLQENYKNIKIGEYIKNRVEDLKIPIERISNFLNINETEINDTYLSDSLNTAELLRWSKLLDYDFFRLYSQHLILYSPPSSLSKNPKITNKSKLPEFRKSIYTKELIDFVLELLETGYKTKIQIVEEYRIPKTTLYKWIEKYSTQKE